MPKPGDRGFLNPSLWDRLYLLILEFKPDVVVLVARKMPRLCERLNWQFGPDVLVISDIAIPFTTSELRSSRVVIVDDVVNVGSTLQKAAQSVRACNPSAMMLAALGRREGAPNAIERNRIEVRYAIKEPLGPIEYRRHVLDVPVGISSVGKPYDMVFPIITAGYPLPFRRANEILQRLTSVAGAERVHVLASPHYNSPCRVVTLQPHPKDRCSGENRKLRLYFNDDKDICNLVPIVVPQRISRADIDWTTERLNPFESSLYEKLKQYPLRASSPFFDAMATLHLFANAFEWFLDSATLAELTGVLDLPEPLQFNMDDAQFLFGPLMQPVNCKKLENAISATSIRTANLGDSQSPFSTGNDRERVLAAAETALRLASPRILPEGFDCYAALVALIDAVANLSGAERPTEYSLTWPYSSKQIREDEYLRLRVGPTFIDLVALLKALMVRTGATVLADEELEQTLSLLLDACIDEGLVVPTLSHDESCTYRIYRRGESNEGREATCRRVLYAWACYGHSLSMIRASKILAVLSLSKEFAGLLTADAQVRGYVATVPKNVLDTEQCEVAFFLRSTGRLKLEKE